MKKPVLVFSYSISNKSSNEVDIHIDGDIVDASTQEFLKAYFGDTTTTSYKSFRNSLNELKGIDTYNVIINSSGGHVGDAMAIHDLITELQNDGKTVNTIGRGIVASSATLILLAGKNPEMSANSWFMMHTVSGGVWGSVDQVENYAATMRKFNNQVRDLYANKSGMRPEEVTKLMDKETWLTAVEAKKKGLVSSVTGEVAFQNKIPTENWQYENSAVLNSYNASVKPENSEIMKSFKEFKTELVNLIKGIKPTKETTNEELVNQIADAVGKSVEGLEPLIESMVNAAVNKKPAADKPAADKPAADKPSADKPAADKPENNDLATVIKNAVEAAVKPFQTKIDELEQEIVDKIGGESKPNKDEAPKIIGKFD